ncbi:aspartate aminotransferase family protein [Halobacillus litoralis]|uniref:Aspartate aminotransferase family protein n=1 Tax=Halobacillus litoralis TaxID=45668 RepID=A0A845DWR6_9BACI|nr:aspartate aminotransferase family protein [Halobacillus litoralis]MYL18517.1 aspartate aminotransferase family protein [Halobacillus litoralis]
MRTESKAQTDLFQSFFLHQDEESLQAFQSQIEAVTETLMHTFKKAGHPFSGAQSDELQKQMAAVVDVTEEARSFQDVLNEAVQPIIHSSLHVSHTKSMAHLHCPPLIQGVAGELLIGALNQSMDSWDQSPAATYVEEEMIRYWTSKAGYSAQADGVFTSGGTQSNYMGLLLARDAFCRKQWNHNVQKQGLPEGFKKLRILCSEEAHFSVKKSAAQLGLGEDAVVPVPVDDQHRMDSSAAGQILSEMQEQQLLPFAVFATSGTTDFGSLDPLEELADLSKEHGLWFHVDAAYGGGLLLSRHRHKLTGLEQADSMTLDFHKWLYQPISSGVFLLKDRSHFNLISHHADYLNSEQDEQEGVLHLVNKSVQTTRRFDALKIFLTLQTLGTDLIGRMIDQTIETAGLTAQELMRRPDFYPENPEPDLSAVVFQYRPEGVDADGLNRTLQQALFQNGRAVTAKTKVNGETYLKFTILNPRTTIDDVKEVLDEFERLAAQQMTGGIHLDKS